MFKSVSWLPDDDGEADGSSRNLFGGSDSRSALDFVRNGTHTAFFVVMATPALVWADRGYWPKAAPSRRRARSSSIVPWFGSTTSASVTGCGSSMRTSPWSVWLKQTAAATNFYSFISLADAKRLLRAGDRVSYSLTQPKPGYSDEDVVAAIGRDLPGVSALTSARFADNSRDIIVKMIGRP
jgi:putative ABC transport system permease protein